MVKFFKIIFIIFTFLYVNFTFLYPQTSDLIFQNLSSADGLPSDRIRAIFQDHLGFLWFGTGNGLVQYDGYQFNVYQSNKNNPYSLSGNDICQIDEDSQGNLWVLARTAGKINKFDRKTRKFFHYLPITEDSTNRGRNGIFHFYLDSSGDLWTVTLENKLGKINTETGAITHYRHNRNDCKSLSCDTVFIAGVGTIRRTALYEDSKGAMWIGTWGGGLVRYHRESDSFFSFKHDPTNPHSLSCDRVSSIFEDSQNNLWICTWGGGLNLYSRQTDRFTRYRHKASDPLSIGCDTCYATILEDKSNNLWITLGNGLDCFDHKREVFTHHYQHDPKDPYSLGVGYGFLPIYEDEKGLVWILVLGKYPQIDRYDPQTGRFFHLKEDYNNPKTIRGNSFLSFFEDHSGTFWMGTNARGVTKYDPLIQNFKNYKHEPGNVNSLSHNRVEAIIESKSQPGVIWIGTPDGLNKYDKRTDTFTHYRHNPDNSNSLSTNHVVSLVEDGAGLLWIDTKPGGGVDCYDAQRGRFVHYDYSSEYSQKHANYNLSQDRSGAIWLKVNGGLVRFNRKDMTITPYLPYPQDPGSSMNKVKCIYEDKDGSLWVGTGGGLKKYIRPRQNFSTFLEKYIRVIYEDSNNNFWLGTGGDGLVLFNRGTGEATFYNQDDGLPSKSVGSITEDGRGNLWLATLSGLSRFNPQTKVFTNFDTRHGLPSNNFNERTGIRTRDGQVWVGTLDNGIVAFNPDDIRINTIPPKIVLTDIKLFNKSLPIDSNSPLKQHISVTKEIQFAHWQNDISLECTALHFSHPQKNQYAFWLENYDKDWYRTGTNRVATYTNLDPGEYIFHAKGANSDHVWNEQEISLRIVIHSPWWQVWWAYLLYVFVVSTVVYIIWQNRLRRVRLRNELKMKQFEAQKLQEVDHLKSRFFANISHEFRTPLTLIVGPLEKLLTETRKENLKIKYKMMLRNTRQLLRLINQLLDFSKLEAGALSLKVRYQDIVPLLRGIVFSFMSLAERKRITLKFQAEQKPILAYIDRDKLENIMSNLLSNAFKFTHKGGKISVAVAIAETAGNEKLPLTIDNCVEIIVADSGVGIPSEHLGRIFDRFFQVDGSHTREQQGSGIGLALTKELVELHHGEISVNSEPGRGTTFTIRLPQGKKHWQENEMISEEVVGEENQHPFSPVIEEIMETDRLIDETDHTKDKGSAIEEDATIILVVEDNRDVRTYIHEHLSPSYQLLEAGDGTEGIEKAREVIPDLIISDIMMPIMDGYELCRILKNDEKTSHIPVILLTAKASSESKLQGLETGADDYLIKPFDSKELLVRVKNLIALRQKLRERFSREVVLKPGDIAITPMDEVFLQRVQSVVEQHLDEEEFSVEILGQEVGMSRTQIHRKLRALIDQSASQFIRSMRLQRAVDLLNQKAGTVAEIAYMVGFNSQAYFTKCFHEQFGCSPKEFSSR